MSQTLCKIDVLPAFALPIIRTRNLISRRRGCCCVLVAIAVMVFRMQDGRESHHDLLGNDMKFTPICYPPMASDESHGSMHPESWVLQFFTPWPADNSNGPIIALRSDTPFIDVDSISHPSITVAIDQSINPTRSQQKDVLRRLHGRCSQPQLPWSPQSMISLKLLSGRYTFWNLSRFYSFQPFRFRILSVGRVSCLQSCRFVESYHQD